MTGHQIVARLRGFGFFWWDFIVGDDWRIAAGVVAALALTVALTRLGVPAWWLMPAAVLIILVISVWRVTRIEQRS